MYSCSERMQFIVSSFKGRVMSCSLTAAILTGGRISQGEQVIETPTPLLYSKQLLTKEFLPREEVTLLTFYISLLSPSVTIHM